MRWFYVIGAAVWAVPVFFIDVLTGAVLTAAIIGMGIQVTKSRPERGER